MIDGIVITKLTFMLAMALTDFSTLHGTRFNQPPHLVSNSDVHRHQKQCICTLYYLTLEIQYFFLRSCENRRKRPVWGLSVQPMQ